MKILDQGFAVLPRRKFVFGTGLSILLTSIMLLGSCSTHRAIRLRNKSIRKWERQRGIEESKKDSTFPKNLHTVLNLKKISLNEGLWA